MINCIRAQRKVNLCAHGAPKGPKVGMFVRQYEIVCANGAGRAPRKYPGAIWDPVLKRDVDKLERVQRQGARWAKGVVSVSGILRELGWKELASRRKEQRLTMLHKILHGEMAIPHDAVNIKHMQRSRSHSMALVRPRASFTASPLWSCTIFASIKDWNQLPSMVEAGTLSTFKTRLTGLSQ